MNRLIAIWKGSAVEERLLWLYVVTLPLMNIGLFSFVGKKILFSDAVFLILLGTALFKILLKRSKFTLPKITGPVLIMLFAFALSFLNSRSMLNSLAELTSLLYLVLLFFLVTHIITDRDKLTRFLSVWLFASLSVSLVGLAAFALGVLSGDLKGNLFLTYNQMDAAALHFPRIRSTFSISNMFSAYLHVSLVFAALLFLLRSGRNKRTFFALSIALLFAASFLTGSRRFAGLLLSLFLMLVLYGKRRAARILKYATFFGFLLFLALYIATSIWVIFPVAVTGNGPGGIPRLEFQGSYSLHVVSHIASLNMFKGHPVIGVGWGAYNKNFGNYIDWGWLKSNLGLEKYPAYLQAIEQKTLNFDPHSLYLGTLAETGLLGFAGLAYFLMAYFFLLLRRIRRSHALGLSRIISGCIMAGYAGFLLNAMTMDILSMRHFWIMLAIGLSCCGQEENKSLS